MNYCNFIFCLLKFFYMKPEEFQLLNYQEQLQLLKQSGQLKLAFRLEKYQFTLYQLKDFYVELKRTFVDIYFEKIVVTNFDNLPSEYKSLLFTGNWKEPEPLQFDLKFPVLQKIRIFVSARLKSAGLYQKINYRFFIFIFLQRKNCMDPCPFL